MNAIHSKTTGNGKRTLILIHGFCSNHEVWDPFRFEIDADWQVITPDLPGFGHSKMPLTTISISMIAKQMNDWVQNSGLHKPVVIGHSMGGFVGLAMVTRQPGLFSGVGLFHSTAMPDTDDRKTGRNRALDFVRIRGVQRFVDTFVPGQYCSRFHQSIPRVHQMAAETSERTFFAYTMAMRDRPSSVELLGKLTMPILFLAGRHDPIFNWEDIEKQANLYPNSTFCLLEDAAHMGMFEASETAKTAVNNFLKKIGKRD